MTCRRSLRARLVIGALGAMAFAWMVVAVAGYFQSRHELGELLDAHLAQSAAILVAQLSDQDEEIELEHLSQLHRYARKVAFQVWSRGRHLSVRSASAPLTRLSSTAEGFSFSSVDGQKWRVFSTWAHDRAALIQVAEQVAARDEVSSEIAWNLLAPPLVSLPFLGFALALVIGRGLKPLNDLAQEVAGRDPNHLEPVLADEAPREVRPLVDQINALFGRIRESLESERRFTADASHELRTPIAAIRAQAQVAQQAGDERQRIHALAQVVSGCDRATHLTEQLLTLARLETGKSAMPMSRIDLASVARSVLAEMGQRAHSKGVTLELIAEAPVFVNGDEALLTVLIRNLVDNGIRYSPPDTTITVRIVANESEESLEVTDQGPGIPAAERQRVLARFYRIVGTEEAGSGLGLSIVARIAELHRAALRLSESASRQGLTVTVAFREAWLE